MKLHLDYAASERAVEACLMFNDHLESLGLDRLNESQSLGAGSFETARQIGAVYSLFGGEDLPVLLDGFVTQARAMATLFAVAGGMIQAEDEAVAAALGKAVEEPAGLQSLGLIHAPSDALFDLGDKCVMGAYGRVGPEDVSESPIEYIARCSEALRPEQFAQVRDRARTVSKALGEAAGQLQGDLGAVLGSGWQGDFATSAQDSVRGLVASADALAAELAAVAGKAERAYGGLETTRTRVREQAAGAQLARGQASIQGPGLESAVAARAELEAAEEQARAIVNTEYSPAVMDANLDDMDFTTAYRVVSTTAIGGPGGVDMARVWNTDGIPRPAAAAAPTAGALTAAGFGAGAGAESAGAGAGGQVAGAGLGARPAADAGTEQALLAARAGGADLPAGAGAGAGAGGGAGVGGPGGAGGAGGVNAATHAAGAPFAPVPAAAANGQQAGPAGIRGIRGADQNGRRSGGFGSAAGAVGSGGAAAAGAGAMRMGGAGTLAGIGGPGLGSPGAGVPGAGGVGATPGAPGLGTSTGSALSSSSSGAGQAGRPGGVPMGGMMGAGAAGNNNDRRGHTPAGYLTNATNTTAIIGDPVRVAPAVIGRAPTPAPAGHEGGANEGSSYRGTVIGRNHTGGGARH